MLSYVFAIFLLIFCLFIRLAFRRNETTGKGAPFVPLEPAIVNRVLDLAQIKKGDIFYDLGSGDGRLVIAAALRGATAYGVEIDPLRVFYSRLWVFIFRLRGRAIILHQDIFATDLSRADVITAYLLQKTNDRLKTKLEKETKTGSRIIGIAFNFPGWKPQKIDFHGPVYGPLYLYRFKKSQSSVKPLHMRTSRRLP